jgi:hypothetical protein
MGENAPIPKRKGMRRNGRGTTKFESGSSFSTNHHVSSYNLLPISGHYKYKIFSQNIIKSGNSK